MKEKMQRSSKIFIFFLILLSILLFLSLTSPVHRWGDASTYYMQISSIAYDHDIQYQPIDLQRALHTTFDDLPTGVFLIKTTSGTYFFGKEFSYALFATPFFIVLGIQGILVFNAVMFWSMILMGFLYLRDNGNSDIVAGGISLLFFTVSTAFVYIFWVHSEIYIMFLVTLGLFLWTKYSEKPGSEKFLLCSAFIFGLATVSRIPNGLLFLPFLFHELYSRRFKRALSLFILFLIPILLFYGYFYAVTGVTSFYGGDQSFYTSNYPFMNSGTGDAGPTISAIGGPGQHGMTMGNSIAQAAVNRLTSINYSNGFNNAIYYFFGRFTGLIWYYPLAAFALISFLILGIRSEVNVREIVSPKPGLMKNPAQFLILTGIILNILFFLFINGSNYFGGQHAVGNRYFWIYPAFLFLIGKVNLKLIIPFILIALVTVLPIISDPISNSQNPQIHTFKQPYPLFPLELNQVRNLPLWFPQPALQNMSFLYTGSDGGILPEYLGSNTYSISGTSHWIILKRGNSDHIRIIFTGIGTGNTNLSVSSGNFRQGVIIKDREPVTITIPFDQPDYYGWTQLYEISVVTTKESHMLPLSNTSEKKEVLYSEGWFDEEKDPSGSWRWMTSHSTLFVYSDTEENKTLRFDASSYSRPYQLSLQAHDNNSVYMVTPGPYSPIVFPIHVHAGYNTVQFDAPEGCTCPSDTSGPYNDDTRCLSVIIRNITTE